MSQNSGRLFAALMTAATLALLFSLLVYILFAANLIPFPFDYDQGEGFELHDTVLFSQGQLPYRDVEVYPFYASNYPPLYHMLAAPFVWIFGPAYWYGRLLSFLASLISAVAIAFAVYRDGARHKWIALLSGLAFLASNFVYHIGPLYRQHALMVTFETLAIVILARAFPSRHRRGIAIALLLLICAGYTKQLAAITAVAAFAWMFLRRPARALSWLLGFAVVGAALFLALQLLSDGHWWTHIIVANVNKFDPLQSFGLFALWFKLHGLLLIPAALMLIFETYCDRLSLFSLWFLASALLGGIASGTWGAGDSYFTTSIAAMCILSGIAFSRAQDGSWFVQGRNLQYQQMLTLARLMPLLIPLLYLGYARATLKMPTDSHFAPLAHALAIEPNVRPGFFDSATFDVPGYANIGYFVNQDDIAAGHSIVAAIEESERPILSEEAGFSIAAGREVITNPTQLRNLYLAGAFAGEELIDMIDERAFALIILRAQFYPPPVLEAIGRSYHLRQTIHMNEFDYLILEPNASSASQP